MEKEKNNRELSKSRRRGSNINKNEATSLPEILSTERELVVVVYPEAGLRASSEGFASVADADVAPLSEIFNNQGIALHPLFGVSEERLKREAFTAAEAGVESPDLSIFYKVEAPDERLEELADQLRENEIIEAAFIKPGAEIPQRLNDMAPAPEPAPPVTADFTLRQEYLNPAPGGVDARFAWTINGGSGAGSKIIDIEGAWRFSHEDLLQNQGGVVAGVQSTDINWRNHGTAVVGEFGGDRNSFGITGICPDSNVRAISIFGNNPPGWGSAAAIRKAADMLAQGDIILIELHRPGPRFNFQLRNDQRGYIAIEWWPDDLLAIQYAISRGVIVVEAAGNGAENLDDPLYDINPAAPNGPFPTWWRNPFRRNPFDSGAIVVGAGAPPPGTHGMNHGPDRSRLDFSNFGALIDAQGWGREVTTVGYGDLQGGGNEDLWYTDRFSGTSSASPIVVGALACVQGARRAAGQALLTPATARILLRTTGSPQQASQTAPLSQRIGNRPNLRQMLSQTPQVATVPLYRYWNPGNGDHFYTTNWAELGGGNHGWGYEGVQCHVLQQQRSGTVPLYRYWNPHNGDHFYTTNWAELGGGKYGWGYEGVQCYVYPTQAAGTVPLYRYWNPGIGDHFYTTNWAELGGGNHGWGYEGIQCYVFSQLAIPPSGESGAFAQPESSADDVLSRPDSSGSESGQATGTLSALPPTFKMGLTDASQVANDSSNYDGSFRMSNTEGGSAENSLGGSFTMLKPSKSGQSKENRSSGQATINIYLDTDREPEA
jgi:hypothetical protein